MIIRLFSFVGSVQRITIAKVNKLQQTRKEANHKLRILRQKLQRQNENPVVPLVDLSGVDVDEEETDNAIRVELALIKEIQNVEDERVRRLVNGSGQGRPKSPAFEFAARTILATGFTCPFTTYCIYSLTYFIFQYTRLFCARGERSNSRSRSAIFNY
jgi:hypothetical protein